MATSQIRRQQQENQSNLLGKLLKDIRKIVRPGNLQTGGQDTVPTGGVQTPRPR
jgi:hypothetical protein